MLKHPEQSLWIRHCIDKVFGEWRSDLGRHGMGERGRGGEGEGDKVIGMQLYAYIEPCTCVW